MEDHFDDSAPAVIMPPLPNRNIINEDEIIDLDAIDNHLRRRNNQHRRQLRWDMFMYATDLSDGMPMNIHENIDALTFTEDVSITTPSATTVMVAEINSMNEWLVVKASFHC